MSLGWCVAWRWKAATTPGLSCCKEGGHSGQASIFDKTQQYSRGSTVELEEVQLVLDSLRKFMKLLDLLGLEESTLSCFVLQTTRTTAQIREKFKELYCTKLYSYIITIDIHITTPLMHTFIYNQEKWGGSWYHSQHPKSRTEEVLSSVHAYSGL